jgi:hypothetical protein
MSILAWIVDFPIRGNRAGNVAIAALFIYFWAVVISRLLEL